VAEKDKPYRVYRGGRVKGPIRHPLRSGHARGGEGDGAYDYRRAQSQRPPKRRRWGRMVLLLVLVFVLLVVVWGTLGYLSFRSGLQEANDRLDPRAERALAELDGSLLSTPANLLILGTDQGPGREGSPRSDAIMLVRTDPDARRVALLSIPRDLRVEIPGHGTDKINAAYAIGGEALALTTVQNVTGLDVHHIAVVDFSDFGAVVDALGGITVDVPAPIVSNRFDCPFKAPAECLRWQGWRFRAGEQELDGRRALVYARIRENRLDGSESDITRGGRQQAVIQAMTDRAVSLNTFVRLPFLGDDLTKPLTTDLGPMDLLELGWVKYRSASDRTLRCRLGGELSSDGSYILGNEDNATAIQMFTGRSAPQPPRPGSELFGAGCLVSG